MSSRVEQLLSPQRGHRKVKEKLFAALCFAAAMIGVFLLMILLVGIFRDGIGRLNLSFLNSFPSRDADRAGLRAALVGSLWVISLTAVIAVPVGIAAAVYLEEFAKKSRLGAFIEVNIANLAGVPSIIYGLLGLAVFVRYADLGRSVIAGSLTLSLLVLPMVIITTQEALRAVPNSLRYASLAMGTTPWQTTLFQTVPAALPGIMTGIILAVSRAMGETAPLITIGAMTYIAYVPKGINDSFTALPIQIYNWANRPQSEFHEIAAAAIIVLLAVLLSLNFTAIVLRNKFQKKMP